MASPVTNAGIIAALSLPIPLGILLTGLRFWSELYLLRRRLAVDDALMIWATVVAVAGCAVGLHSVCANAASEDWTSSDYLDMRMLYYVFFHLYILATAATKLPVLALYHRAFPSSTLQRIAISTAAIVLLWQISFQISWGLSCTPVQRSWDKSVPGKCGDVYALALAHAVSNLVMDIWIFLLPLPLILRMRGISCRKKALLAGLFSLGVCICGIGASRIAVFVCMNTLPQGAPRTLASTLDAILTILSVYEPLGGIFCANLPITYKPCARGLCRVFGLSLSADSTPSPGNPHSWYARHIALKREVRGRAGILYLEGEGSTGTEDESRDREGDGVEMGDLELSRRVIVVERGIDQRVSVVEEVKG